ncbi:Aste57867_15043 [Aphanomyces stellatus]|uniref:Aste57867_15042 protein n=1 Tax=Aphanomyces stellatus TaxID=120398 RepID=A0A485L288_9STRA|nr:hypothetical protein As57867_014986 [Aphanomyces stellatus]KAF0694050.1 hypothetical protein As57867_014987 [Aphanomyces stellatus]KAF0708570.1 hypothetical protein As57867_006286 [Aphanomyces stellatus]VFT83298.1 Aste57867_6300 [Aphanomyces stellatus]VFT91856.1 Aste57867_15042 [Aphanomyces stellatus]
MKLSVALVLVVAGAASAADIPTGDAKEAVVIVDRPPFYRPGYWPWWYRPGYWPWWRRPGYWPWWRRWEDAPDKEGWVAGGTGPRGGTWVAGGRRWEEAGIHDGVDGQAQLKP